MLFDNYCYYIHATDDIEQGYFVDVAKYDKLVKFRNDFGIKEPVTNILTTHKHFDHAGGNLKVKEMFPDVTIMGGI